MMRILLTFIVMLAANAVVQAEHRVALLIANADYGEHQLASPASDAKAVANVLGDLDFRTTIA